ncbi:ISC system FeS cluster assembly, IscU scaffold [Kipferlia bialata]|uniref:Iron-sulfur cluster assembly protein n=1 Tax=Kipferlia bialata TaxID=797122 RepID=A0A391NM35_9EUKA|nr:ISC system FeS cluster assembly, IscU scaffold [Kipferlia bialata]|eukprot:g6006.t1
MLSLISTIRGAVSTSLTGSAFSGAARAFSLVPDEPTSYSGYADIVDEHYSNPRNVGTLDAEDDDVGTGLVGAPACGDVMRLQIRVDDDGNISDVKFKTFGCGAAVASSSYATELISGGSLEDAMAVKNTDIAEQLALPPVKMHCSMLAEEAIQVR